MVVVVVGALDDVDDADGADGCANGGAGPILSALVLNCRWNIELVYRD